MEESYQLGDNITELEENNLSTQSNIDVSDLNPGMYLLRLQFENGEQVTRKFVKD